MNNIDFTINQVQRRYDWQEVIGKEKSTTTVLGFITKDTSKSIFKQCYRIVDAETDELIETNTDTLPLPGLCENVKLTFTYSSDTPPSNIDDMLSRMNGNFLDFGHAMPKLTIDRPTCTLHGVFIIEWNPKINGGTGSVDFISYK